MPVAKFFNKGMLRGTLTKSEIVTYEGKDGKAGGSFLSTEVDTGGSNKVKATVFNTRSNPNKAQEYFDQFPVGSKVEVVGNVQEREYESNGKKGIDRSIGANKISILTSGKEGATFIIQGIVNRIREKEEGAEVEVKIDTSYVREDKTKVEQEEIVHLMADKKAMDLLDDLDIARGDNVKFKGKIFNTLVFDDYGDIESVLQMFKIDKAEDVIHKDDISQPEELPFL